jgi:protease-4
MKQFLITLAAVITAMIVVFIGIPVMLIAMAASSSGPKHHGNVVVSIDLRGGLSDQSRSGPFDFLTGSSLSTMKIVSSLHSMADDPNVKAVIIRLPEGGMAPAAAEEIRAGIRYVRAANKPVLAHSQGLYPDTMVAASYMVGAASSEMWMQPNASFQVTGMGTTNLFLKRAFDKYGIKASFEQRYEYKNAVNQYLYDDYTPAHREATLSWMGSIYDNMIKNVAEDRKSTQEAIKTILEAGPYGADEAKAKGLITKIGQLSEMEIAAKKLGGDKTEIIDISDYSSTHKKPAKGQAVIAVINGEGAILTGTDTGGGFNEESMMASDVVSKAFDSAIKDKNVKAIVFRVSSPGGSDTASEQIADAIERAKAAKKPVIISMGNYAASGGYWISAGATKIVSNPSTLTGSIGVYGGKMAIGDAASRFGLDFRDIGVGSDYALAYSEAQDFSPKQRATIAGWIDHIYNSFVARVAKGRNIPEARVREIAKGRVWTGEQALGLKLVDKLGGFYVAVDEAKAAAKLGKDSVKIVEYSADSSPFGKFGASVKATMRGMKALSFIGWAMSDPKAEMVIERMKTERLHANGANVYAPEPYATSVR